METNRLELAKDQVLFSEGDKPDNAYLIESGEIEVNTVSNGKNLILGILTSGDILGEMAIIDQSVRSAGAIAKTDCVLIKITKDQFLERLIKSDPIVRSLLISLLRRYRSTLSTLKGEEEELSFSDTNIFERVTINKIRLEGQLRAAILNDGLDLRFQPVLNLETNEVAGFEALVRWNHPEHGFISPDEFVSLAEETSLIFEVGEYVIEESCKAVRTMLDSGKFEHVFIAVNISARQLAHPELVESIAESIKKHNIPKNSIKIEITEGLALDTKEVQYTIIEAHKNGIEVALDDFGTGYSNLTLLHKLNFDTIKIDQAFARGVVDDPRSIILVKTICEMCKSLDADVLVEGVEDGIMLDILKNLGAMYAQGYYIGKPQTMNEILLDS